MSYNLFIATIISMEIAPYKQKKIKLIFVTLILFFFVILLSFYIYLKILTPKMDGFETLKRLEDRVDIYRDLNGIPHLMAQNNRDLYRSLGFLMASERLFQMEISRRLASGELSEILGEKGLKSDIMFRSLGLRSQMKEMLEFKKSKHLDNPKMWEEMQAFYDGVNQYQASHPLPIEFKILGIKPRPFEPLDGYTFIGLMSFSFAIATMQDPLFTTLEKRLGHELVEEMRLEKINSPQKSIITEKKNIFIKNKIPELISFLEKGFPLFHGSNGWILSKKRTINGENMLVNDPHITYSQPGIWFEASLHCPEIEIYGHFLPLIPFPVLAHSKNHAHGLTMSLIDDMDLYREKIENDMYYFKGKKYPLKHNRQLIKIKGQKDYLLDVRISQHGPILDDFLSEKSLALKWVFYDRENDPISIFYRMNNAKNMHEFKSAVKDGVAPGLNILYADKDNIGWWIFGKVMMRPPQMRSDFILDGESGKDEYIKEMSFEEKPHIENPLDGVIISANSRPLNFPTNQRGDWQPDDRYSTINNIISKKEKWSEPETMELQTLSLNLENKLLIDQILKDLSQVKNGKEYLPLLQNWDLVSDKNAVAPTLFFIFINQLAKNVLEKELNTDELETYSKLPAAHSFIKRLILDPQNPWWQKYHRQSIFEITFIESIEKLKNRFGLDTKNWTWGKVHSLEFSHPLGKIWPLNTIFNLGPYPLSGATQDINNQKSSNFKDVFEVRAGPSTRRIVSFAHLDSTWGILPVGVSAHLLSPFYKNQLNDYLLGNYRPMLLSKELIKSHSTHHLILNN